MIDVNALRKGVIFTEDAELFKVLEYNHIQKGRGGATIRLKVLNLRTNAIVEKTFKNGGQVQDIRLDHSASQYLYNDGELYHFMNTQTFDQFTLPKSRLADIVPYLTENMLVEISTYQDEPIDIEIPVSVDLEVVQAEPGFAGNTAQGVTKPVTVSTGLIVHTPIFVKIGDIIRIDTRTGQYVTRV